jgi:hypothetical protein
MKAFWFGVGAGVAGALLLPPFVVIVQSINWYFLGLSYGPDDPWNAVGNLIIVVSAVVAIPVGAVLGFRWGYVRG